jgi:hypothetical protein
MTNLLQFTITFETPTVNLSALCKSCAKIACCSSELIFTFLYAGSSIQNASEQFVSCIHLSFVNFALHPNPQKKKKKSNERCAPDSNSNNVMLQIIAELL